MAASLSVHPFGGFIRRFHSAVLNRAHHNLPTCLSSGCMRRNHMPPEVDAGYNFAVQTKSGFYERAFAQQGEEMKDVREKNWIVKARKVKRDQLMEIFDGLEVHRTVIRRFEGLELDDEDLEKFEVGNNGEVKLREAKSRF